MIFIPFFDADEIISSLKQCRKPPLAAGERSICHNVSFAGA
jgi:hypothetical protein